MFASALRPLPFVASFLVTLSLASPAILGKSCQSNHTHFTLSASPKSGLRVSTALTLILPSNTSSISWIGATHTQSMNSENFSLTDGGVNAIAPDGGIIAVSNSAPDQNSPVSFTFVGGYETPTPATGVYCVNVIHVVSSLDGNVYYSLLAVNGGDSDHFSLCQRTGSGDSVLVYGVVGQNFNSSGYNFADCKEVDVYVFP